MRWTFLSLTGIGAFSVLVACASSSNDSTPPPSPRMHRRTLRPTIETSRTRSGRSCSARSTARAPGERRPRSSGRPFLRTRRSRSRARRSSPRAARSRRSPPATTTRSRRRAAARTRSAGSTRAARRSAGRSRFARTSARSLQGELDEIEQGRMREGRDVRRGAARVRWSDDDADALPSLRRNELGAGRAPRRPVSAVSRRRRADGASARSGRGRIRRLRGEIQGDDVPPDEACALQDSARDRPRQPRDPDLLGSGRGRDHRRGEGQCGNGDVRGEGHDGQLRPSASGRRGGPGRCRPLLTGIALDLASEKGGPTRKDGEGVARGRDGTADRLARALDGLHRNGIVPGMHHVPGALRRRMHERDDRPPELRRVRRGVLLVGDVLRRDVRSGYLGNHLQVLPHDRPRRHLLQRELRLPG